MGAVESHKAISIRKPVVEKKEDRHESRSARVKNKTKNFVSLLEDVRVTASLQTSREAARLMMLKSRLGVLDNIAIELCLKIARVSEKIKP